MKTPGITSDQFMFVNGRPRSCSLDNEDALRMFLNVEVSERRFYPRLNCCVSFGRQRGDEGLALVTYNPRMFDTLRTIQRECVEVRATIELTGIMTIRPVSCPGVTEDAAGLYEGDLVIRGIEGWVLGNPMARYGFSEGMQLN